MIHYYRYLFEKTKVFNYSELHFSDVTSYKINTLVGLIDAKGIDVAQSKWPRGSPK